MKACLKIKCSYFIKTSKNSENNFDDAKPKIKFSKSRIEEIRKKFNKSRQIF